MPACRRRLTGPMLKVGSDEEGPLMALYVNGAVTGPFFFEQLEVMLYGLGT